MLCEQSIVFQKESSKKASFPSEKIFKSKSTSFEKNYL